MDENARPELVEGPGFAGASLSGPTPPEGLFTGQNLSVLLGRPLRAIDIEGGKRHLAGATVLVTGAAGSVGRALVRRLLDYQPRSVAAVDTHEASLFQLSRDLPTDAPVDFRVADVRNETKIRRLFREVGPRVVFHL